LLIECLIIDPFARTYSHVGHKAAPVLGAPISGTFQE